MPRISGSVTLLPEFELDASARVSIVRRPAELMLGVAVGSWVLANAELSVIAERSVRKTVSTTAAFQPTRSSTHWDLGLGPRVGAIWLRGRFCTSQCVGALISC